MLRHIHFRCKNGGWNFIVRERYPLFIEWVKRGEVSAVDAETILLEEVILLAEEGFALIPDEIVVGCGDVRQPIKILKIERS